MKNFLSENICKAFAGNRAQTAINAVFILAPAFLAAFKYSYAGLNADIILNQIMAAHNVTLFYWGQNRLLNVAPFLLQLASGPLTSLFFTLFIATLSFFGVLWFCALMAGKLENTIPGRSAVRLVYLLNVFGCCLFFKFDAWVSICLWHFEYSLALLLLLSNIFAVYYHDSKFRARASFFAAFIAFGVNPALILLAAPMLAGKCLICRGVTARDWLCMFCWCVFFVFWIFAGRLHGSYDDYSTVAWGAYGQGMEKFVVNLFSEYLDAGRLLACGALALLVKFFWPSCARRDRRSSRIMAWTGLCAFAYAGFVACIRWYHMNQCSPRYFIFLIYLAIFAFSLWVWPYLARRANARWQKIAAPVLLLPLCCYFYPPGFNLHKTDIYNECHNTLPANNNLYVGDYWKIWACASRDMNRGYNSFVLGYRGDADRRGIDKYLAASDAQGGRIEIYCLNAPIEECRRQLDAYFLSHDLLAVEKLNGKALKLTLGNICFKKAD